MDTQTLISSFVLLWAVIDPIGTVPVFISATRGQTPEEKRKVAKIAALVAAGILVFFIVVGEIILRSMGVPLLAFQISGGVILFLFALTMIFGESKPDEELKTVKKVEDAAIFPLATPSIASPGAIMGVVLLTENGRHSLPEQAITTATMLVVVFIAYLMMLGAGWLYKYIGSGGASIVSRVMGLILASIAATNILQGIKEYFNF
ncbi:MarC family protein [Akkermansiaceae bacterium]|nr:MarC family protein [Akkermansiaceae bacterium]